MSDATSGATERGPAAGGPRPAVDRVFYDGNCGLCHGAVRFALARDRAEGRFRFAPLQGETFRALLPAERRAALPDSLVVLARDGRLLSRSDGVLYLGERIGGPWRLASRLLRALPRPLRDLVYDLTARLRHRLFRRPAELCPAVEAELRARFDP